MSTQQVPSDYLSQEMSGGEVMIARVLVSLPSDITYVAFEI